LLLRDRWLQEIHPTASAGLGENERENEPAKHALSVAQLRRTARTLTRITSGGRGWWGRPRLCKHCCLPIARVHVRMPFRLLLRFTRLTANRHASVRWSASSGASSCAAAPFFPRRRCVRSSSLTAIFRIDTRPAVRRATKVHWAALVAVNVPQTLHQSSLQPPRTWRQRSGGRTSKKMQRFPASCICTR
jgi:hypothetical protein